MIVLEPPYELIALFACADAMKFFESVIERGQSSGCVRRIRWRSLRDPSRDQVCNAPERLLEPFLHEPSMKYIVLWDRDGCGRESEAADAVERDVIDRMARRSVNPAHVVAVALVPEVECVLAPVWPRVVEVLAEARKRAAPGETEILRRLASRGFDATVLTEALERYPKETFESLVYCIGSRRSAALYELLGSRLSIPRLKASESVARITAQLVNWFPPLSTPPSEDAAPADG